MQIIQSTSTSATFNLATEEYLFSKSQDEFLLFYVNEPSVILGCNQAVLNEVNFQFCSENDIKVVRRMSGGGAVYHDLGNLNYCFISNKKDGKSLFNEDFLFSIVEVLKSINFQIEIGKRKDLWINGEYKISGTASHFSKSRELYHGTLLYNSNLNMLKNALTSEFIDSNIKAIASVRSKVRNLRTFLNEQGQATLENSSFFHLVMQRMAQFYNINSVSLLSENEIKFIQLIEEEKFKSKEWTFKK